MTNENGIVVAAIAGLPLEVVEKEWVTLRSVFGPFGKEVGEQMPRLREWAGERLRKYRLPSQTAARDSAGNPIPSDTWCIHWRAVPMAIAELPIRGMTFETRTGLVRFKQECEEALAAYFFEGQAVNPRAAASPADPWAAITALAGGTLELRTAVGDASARADAARARADAAHELAEQAVALAGSRSVIEEVIRSTPPGASTATPDGAWSQKPPEGYKSQRAVARDFALPSDGTGANFVGQVARALGVCDDPQAVSFQAVVIGGRERRPHVTYGPKALERLTPALRFAYVKMAAHGYHVVHGVMQTRGEGVRRSKAFVLGEMLTAATAGAGGLRPANESQTELPGVERQAS